MFFDFAPAHYRFNLNCTRLSNLNRPDYFEKIAEWIENKWGYVRGYPGMEFRRASLARIAEYMHVITYGDTLVGCFALIDTEATPDQLRHDIRSKELMFVYIDEQFRGLGIGKQMIETAKNICRAQGKNMLVLDTLNPNLNHFYERCGATVVTDALFTVNHDDQLRIHPSTIMRFDLTRP